MRLRERKKSPYAFLTIHLIFIAILSFFFAQVEIQIEGAAGWAANLPTWRIESHWLLDIFWGGRAMTGYHAWVFPFIALLFHWPIIACRTWTIWLQMRILASLAFFWIIEDFLWFVLNPSFDLAKFSPAYISWHKHWVAGLPTDYWVIGVLAILFLVLSCREN